MTTDKLYHIAQEQSSVCWEFTCECGEVSKVKLNNRSSVYSCIVGEGVLNTSESIEDYQKYGKCKKRTFIPKPINLRKILTHGQWNLFEMIAREMDDGNMYVSIQPSENNGGRQL
ncbi:MAG: hypothetical protein MI921_27595 [Cytophagales bacterium]|nr:hypothetical protein [Cytophagales bacterium]